MKINLAKILTLAERATQVVNWYPHGPYDGYHLGEGSVRGPFFRWLIVKEGSGWDASKPKPVADVEDDAKFAAAAMNSVVPLVTEIKRLRDALMPVAACFNCGGCRDAARDALKQFDERFEG